MKHFKKMMALVIAMVMIVGTMNLVAFGAAGEATPDASITISGLDAGDQVQFYQVLKWQDSVGWVLTDTFAALTSDMTTFPTKLDPGYTPEKRKEEVVGLIADGISMEEAQAISALAKNKTATATVNVTGTSATYTTDTTAKAGLYMAVIGAIDPEVTYLPVFASADFKATNATNAIDASKSQHTPVASGDAVAKKSWNHVFKTTEDTTSSVATAIDSKVGMEVDFYVDTVIPVYFDCYDPSYRIDDSITTGIALKAGTVTVTLDGVAATSSQCTVTENAPSSYSVVFTKDYLLSNKAPVNVHIAYKGTVTRAADFNVNEDDNTVTVTYKNGPSDVAAALRDKTNHYTFSIGADAFGADQPRGSTYELIKVAAEKDGTPIFSETNVQTWEGEIKRHPLANATFKLYTDQNCTVPYSNTYYPSSAGGQPSQLMTLVLLLSKVLKRALIISWKLMLQMDMSRTPHRLRSRSKQVIRM